MLIDTFDREVIDNYCKYLKCVGMLSKLSSESEAPYINPRVAENAFCLATKAENLGRADCSIDAKYGTVGIGIKTFLAGNNKTMQKIAEFNKDAVKVQEESPEVIVSIIANLRNKRLKSTKGMYGIQRMIYHCIVREKNKIRICECDMEMIDEQNIKGIKQKNNDNNVIYFTDGKNEYSFNKSKNTLYKRFDTAKTVLSIDVNIIDEPYSLLARLLAFETSYKMLANDVENQFESVKLPLFSEKNSRHVPEKSGLNQWNAGGRKRDINEVYIPIPSWIHKKFPDFFPGRDIIFKLKLPNDLELQAKVCQDRNKALMSNPNKVLGKWLLREVLNVEPKEIVTYEKLIELGIDSVEVIKISSKEYKIEFRPVGTYDEFVELYK